MDEAVEPLAKFIGKHFNHVYVFDGFIQLNSELTIDAEELGEVIELLKQAKERLKK